MDDISIIASILATLMVGGILVLLIEFQNLDTYVVDRYYQRITPFYQRLTGFVRFLHFYSTCYIYKDRSDKFTTRFINRIKTIERICANSIATGADISGLSREEMEVISENINMIWDDIDRNPSWFDEIEWAEHIFDLFKEQIRDSLISAFPHYENEVISKDILYQVVGEAYMEFGVKDGNIFLFYEDWNKTIRQERSMVYASLGLDTILLSLIIIGPNLLPLTLLKVLSVFVCIFLFAAAVCMSDLNKKAKHYIR